MALVKIVCPKCSGVYTVDPERKYQGCPLCGAPLFEGEEIDLPDLSTPSDVDSLDKALSYGFRLLYFRSYDRLLDLSKLMKESYPDNYWTLMFELIGKTQIDFIFLLPKIEYELSDEEVKEDAKSRYYHYARIKYSKSPQSTFNKIAGYYPDVPGNNRKKWNKAKTKYEEKVALIDKYSEIAALIRNEYINKLDDLAVLEEQKNINHNLKIWLDQIAHAKLDLFRYNQAIETCVKDDYDRTPNPGNKPIFIIYSLFYAIAFVTFVLSIAQFVLQIVNSNVMNNKIMLYATSTTYTLLILLSSTLLFLFRGTFRQHPVLSVFTIVGLTLVCASGIATAGIYSRVNWFTMFAAVFAIISLFITSVRLVKYFPRKCNVGTIIGDYQKLSANSFEVSFSFAFKDYEGETPKDILFSEEWIHEE